jgi:ubiquinone/menaquinone biosynthesis C-methylase UbiE
MSETTTTTATYDRIAGDFAARWGEGDVETLAAGRARFAAYLGAGATVLDVGCGPGRDTARLHDLGLRVYGLDRSLGMLVEAHQRHTCPLLLDDMRHLPAHSGVFDGLWVCASFLHIPKRDGPAVLQEFRRVLRPGGLLYLAVKGGVGERWVTNKAGLQSFFAFYNEEELDALLGEHGFVLRERWIGEDFAGRPEPWLNRIVARET